MTDLDRGRELIEKYLDDVIDKVELAELELLIVSDPEIAKEFARCARTDGFVYSRYNQFAAEQALQLQMENRNRPTPEKKPQTASSCRTWMFRGPARRPEAFSNDCWAQPVLFWFMWRSSFCWSFS